MEVQHGMGAGTLPAWEQEVENHPEEVPELSASPCRDVCPLEPVHLPAFSRLWSDRLCTFSRGGQWTHDRCSWFTSLSAPFGGMPMVPGITLPQVHIGGKRSGLNQVSMGDPGSLCIVTPFSMPEGKTKAGVQSP